MTVKKMEITTALNELQALLGPKGFVAEQDVIAPWLTDWRGRYTGKAAAMLQPQSTEEVSAIMRIANRHRLPLVPQGGNSGMVAGATPDGTGASVLLSLRRMNHVRTLDTESRLVTAEAGVILQSLHETVTDHGLRFPLTLGGKGSATIGGLVSTNAGGTQVLRHGTMRHLVEGIEAVLPDGSIYSGLVPLKKDNRGYDLKHLLVGAEGTLGVITAAALRCVPAINDRVVAWVGIDSADSAYRLLRSMQSEAGALLEGFEILPQEALDAVLQHIPGTRPPLNGVHRWHVLMEFVEDRFDREPLADYVQNLLGTALSKGLVNDATLAANEAQAEAFWKIRDSISEAERAEGPAMQHDISVPVVAMARFIENEGVDIERRFPGTRAVAFGHLGDGNIHFHVKAPPAMASDIWYGELGERVSAHVYERVLAYDGSISAEHGIGQAKLIHFEKVTDPARLGALRAIKTALDPLNIMNPGKLVPLASHGAAA